VLEHYRSADLFVLGCEVAPNGDRDGIPNVLVESMAMGVPVVATDISAISELVQDGKTGLLTAAGQPDKLAEAMQRMLTDTELRHRVIPAARQTVAEAFDNRRLTQDLAEVYRNQGIGQMTDDRGQKTEDR
jgi:glycosyltransferase involved in cell wall biosynthesis